MRSVFLMTIGLALVGCNSELDGKTAAEVTEAAPTPEAPSDPAPAAAAAGMLKANPAASKIGFVGAKVTGDHTGSFGAIDGLGKVEGGALVSTSWTVDMTTLEADHPKLTKHLRGEDFFAVETHKEASFESTSIKATGGDPSHEVVGNMTIKGVSKQITFPANIDVTDAGATLKAEFTIKRFDWGVVYPGKPDDLIKDEVLLKVDVALK